MSKEIGQIVKDFYHRHILKIKTESEQQKDRDYFTEKGTELINKLNKQLYLASDITKRLLEIRGDTDGSINITKYMEKLRQEMIEAGQNPEVELLDGQEQLSKKLLDEEDNS